MPSKFTFFSLLKIFCQKNGKVQICHQNSVFFFTFEDFFVKKMEVKKIEKVFFLKKLKEVVPIKLNQ